MRITRGFRLVVRNSLRKNRRGGSSIPFRLDQNINCGTLLIDRSPQVMLPAVDLQKHFIQEPFVLSLRPSSFQLGGIGRTELIAPVPDGFVREENAAKGPHQFHITQAQSKVEVQPNALRSNLFRKSVTAIGVGWHSLRILSARLDNAPRSFLVWRDRQ